MPIGTLVVTVEKAQDIKCAQRLGKQDPYAVVYVDQNKHRTRIARDQGRNPIWNEQISLLVFEGLNTLHIELFNKNTLVDDHLGTIDIPLVKAFADGKQEASLPVVLKSGRIQGTLSVAIHFEGCGSGTPNGYPPITKPALSGYDPTHRPTPIHRPQQTIPPSYPQAVSGPPQMFQYASPGGAPPPYFSCEAPAMPSYAQYPNAQPSSHAPVGYPQAHPYPTYCPRTQSAGIRQAVPIQSQYYAGAQSASSGNLCSLEDPDEPQRPSGVGSGFRRFLMGHPPRVTC